MVKMAKTRSRSRIASNRTPGAKASRASLWKITVTLLTVLAGLPLAAKDKDGIQYGMGLIVNVPYPVSDVTQVVEDVSQNGIIRGTKEYNKDEYVSGATEAKSSRVFPKWTEGGRVFYKEKLKALDPRNFKDGGDVGTLAVRYIVQPQGDNHTVLRIEAVFVEDFRRVSHASNGSVESAEYKDIHDRLESVGVMKAETAEAEKEKADAAAGKTTGESSSRALPPADGALYASASAADTKRVPMTLEQRVKDLRRQVQRTVKSPGAPLKSAPFNTASTLQSLPTGTEVLIVVSTTYWFGVETHDGQHGWIMRDELEQLP